MGWSLGYDSTWKRDIGYGVPAVCDDPECRAEIDRGLSHVCGGEPFGGECGCGLYFCDKHLLYSKERQLCARCYAGEHPFTPKPDAREWLEWKLTDPSWTEWRASEPDEVRKIEAALSTPTPATSADARSVGGER